MIIHATRESCTAAVKAALATDQFKTLSQLSAETSCRYSLSEIQAALAKLVARGKVVKTGVPSASTLGRRIVQAYSAAPQID